MVSVGPVGMWPTQTKVTVHGLQCHDQTILSLCRHQLIHHAVQPSYTLLRFIDSTKMLGYCRRMGQRIKAQCVQPLLIPSRSRTHPFWWIQSSLSTNLLSRLLTFFSSFPAAWL
jgi:hypothetical protein